MSPILQIKNLQVDFVTEIATITAVRNITLEVNRKEIVAIVGESGSGKSVTALSVLQLLPQPPARFTEGQILFSAESQTIDLLKQTPDQLRQIRGNQIAMIFQEPMTSLNPVFTCGNQVMEAIRLHQGMSSHQAKGKTIELFEKVKLPDAKSLFDRYPHQLSGGQKQRVMIAIAMSCQPDLLICDEPTTALDVSVQKTILELIRELQQSADMGVIFITHDLGVVAEIADRAIVMYKGNIVEQGRTEDLFNKPQHPYTKGLLACRPILHKKGERLPVVKDFLNTDEPLQHSASLQKETGPKQNDSISITADANKVQKILLEINNLSIWYPTRKTLFGKTKQYVKAIDDVSFEVYEGETLGLVGESGSGKTTLGRALLRLVEPRAGRIIYRGNNLIDLQSDEIKKFRKNVQIIFQDPYSSLNPKITIGNAISEPLKVHQIITNEKQRKKRVIELLEKVNLKADHFNRYPHEFSGGQRQRIVIARALALDPDFIVCDESVSALDVSVQAQVLNLLNDLKSDFGFTNIFISHDLSVIHYISDRIMVMNKGRIEEVGSAEQVYLNPRSPYTQKLIASIPKGPTAA